MTPIDALLSQLREQRERAERAEAQAYEWQWQFGQSCKTVELQTNMRFAAERTVREQREVLERIGVEFDADHPDKCPDTDGPCLTCIASAVDDALAALAPNTSEITT